MKLLREGKMPLNGYKGVMDWHVAANKRNPAFREGGVSPAFVTPKAVYKHLFRRYNMENMVNHSFTITLPYSGAFAKIVSNDLGWCIQSMLTDPSIDDDDYLFHDNNPFQAPPADLETVGDINTSQAYYNAYSKYITDPAKQILLPVIFYIDGTVTGQFNNTPITALKFTLANVRGRLRT